MYLAFLFTITSRARSHAHINILWPSPA